MGGFLENMQLNAEERNAKGNCTLAVRAVKAFVQKFEISTEDSQASERGFDWLRSRIGGMPIYLASARVSIDPGKTLLNIKSTKAWAYFEEMLEGGKEYKGLVCTLGPSNIVILHNFTPMPYLKDQVRLACSHDMGLCYLQTWSDFLEGLACIWNP
jgi:hypothetical protein